MKNPMKKFELVIVGGGLTAARAIKSYRESGGGGPSRAADRRGRPALSPARVVEALPAR